jgi:hypothetical protein
MRLVLAVLFILLIPQVSAAQTTSYGVFEDYSALRMRLDDLIKRREIKELMIAFGGTDEMSEQQLDRLQSQVRGFYANDFNHVDVLRVDQMGEGWRQELIAYWGDGNTNYMFVRILLHERGPRIVAAEFDFNSNFREIISLF